MNGMVYIGFPTFVMTNFWILMYPNAIWWFSMSSEMNLAQYNFSQ